MLACCGLQCDTCPIFLATQETDKLKKQSMHEMIAQIFLQYYNIQMLPEEVADCDGCYTTTGRIFPGCFKCEVRACARKRNLESCAFCEDFACTKLNEVFMMEPTTKIRLEEIRNANMAM